MLYCMVIPYETASRSLKLPPIECMYKVLKWRLVILQGRRLYLTFYLVFL